MDTKGGSLAIRLMAVTRLQAGTQPPRAHCIRVKCTDKGRVTHELQKCIARRYLPSVTGRLLAHAKIIGMNERGTSGTLDPVPYALPQ